MFNYKARYAAWINRRLPRQRSVTLNQRRIFIFPSMQGLYFLLLLLVMLVAAINYQNNMVFGLVFLLGSLFVVSILHTYANLSGLTIKAIRASSVFAGDDIEFELSVSRNNQRHYFDVLLHWPDSEIISVTLDKQEEQLVYLHQQSQKRGLFLAERLCVETFYPIGLLRAWTWLSLDVEAIVYPRPLKGQLAANKQSDSEEGDVVPVAGSDDFYQFNEYRPGDSLKHVFWKSYAKGQPLQTKQFAAYRESSLWLDWDSVSGDSEQRLSTLCYWVLKLDERDDVYGLSAPGVCIQPGHGEQHRQSVLTALALFQHSNHDAAVSRAASTGLPDDHSNALNSTSGVLP